MSECTKGELKAEAFPGTINDPTWIIQEENNGIIFQTIGENDKANAKELVRRWNGYEDGGLVEELRTALKEIRDLETDCCPRCEGGGRLWTDGKAHFPHEKVDTIPCGSCGGSGRILPENAQNIAEAALAKS